MPLLSPKTLEIGKAKTTSWLDLNEIPHHRAAAKVWTHPVELEHDFFTRQWILDLAALLTKYVGNSTLGLNHHRRAFTKLEIEKYLTIRVWF
jgi:hypothetical protein